MAAANGRYRPVWRKFILPGNNSAINSPTSTAQCQTRMIAPQQTTLPLVLIAHVLLPPALIALNVPVGAAVWP